MQVTVYTKPGCHLCDDALQVIDKLTSRYDLQVAEVNILEDMAIYERYKLVIPVIQVTDVQVGPLTVPVTEAGMHAYFVAAQKAISREANTSSKRRFLPFARSSNSQK
ncbi:MAG: glutaredoxin family protein [Chloroflexota bacterium]